MTAINPIAGTAPLPASAPAPAAPYVVLTGTRDTYTTLGGGNPETYGPGMPAPTNVINHAITPAPTPPPAPVAPAPPAPPSGPVTGGGQQAVQGAGNLDLTAVVTALQQVVAALSQLVAALPAQQGAAPQAHVSGGGPIGHDGTITGGGPAAPCGMTDCTMDHAVTGGGGADGAAAAQGGGGGDDDDAGEVDDD